MKAAHVAWFVKLASACIMIFNSVHGKGNPAWHVWNDLVRHTPVLGLNTTMPASDYTQAKSTDSVHGEWSFGPGVSRSISCSPSSLVFPLAVLAPLPLAVLTPFPLAVLMLLLLAVLMPLDLSHPLSRIAPSRRTPCYPSRLTDTACLPSLLLGLTPLSPSLPPSSYLAM